jgi:hypothetical protein
MTYTFVKHGRRLEVPLSRCAPAVLRCCGLSWLALHINRSPPVTTTPEWVAAAERIGPVSQRTEAPPAFLNPIRNRIPGTIVGPDDLTDSN